MMIDTKASVALPSHEKFSVTRPVWRSVQLITLNVGSKIHIQATVDSTVGTMNGRSRRARARFLPRNCWLMTSAMARPPVILRNVATFIYTIVATFLKMTGVLRLCDEVGEAHEAAGAGHPTV